MTEYIDELDSLLVNFAKDADLLVVDGQYTREQYRSRLGWGHATMDDAVETAMAANAKRVAVYHHDPAHNDEFLDEQMARLQQMTADAGSSTEVIGACEGLEIKL